MRVLQLIDSLRPGGAEKMAVNIANALVPHVEKSFLCCTRQEGLLNDEVKSEVGYRFLNKKSLLDLKAILKLRKYIKKNEIDIVHAHSTSFFIAGLLKLSGSNFVLIWHDHYGESENLAAREFFVLKKFSSLFAGIISVNTELQNWAVENLHCKRAIEIKNFIPEHKENQSSAIRLKGPDTDFKVICVANLRPQKDHLNLLKAFELLETNFEVSLHLIGEDPKTPYSEKILNRITNSSSGAKIFFYGVQSNILPLLQQAELGVLSSKSEGLPLALLEYGLAGLPVVCTNVGKCPEVVGKTGTVVEKENSEALSKGILFYLKNKEKAELEGKSFRAHVLENYSEEQNIKEILKIYKSGEQG